ncbi:putative glycogen debranching enzyme [Paenibacillus anaericanus]|uniref:amylo-alpha-1,6-glucosidase n=1 Tax=Paenibacillus anaericanus TaxID=170367 RepID=UPI00277D89ED|nr:amylo-alpha-1,6-glucosidase [Paenibacillus anaericanus]MDQ0089386.1 putative glycogen debranching enzyme [Paenibacillus anaericanus]
MDRAYILGRSAWRNIQEGNEREWLIGNGIGGYANHSVPGGGYRMSHGYLVSSSKAPVNRMLVFTRTQEQLKIGGRIYDLTSQQYVNWEKNGQQHLKQFKLDTVPEYHYQVEDVRIRKTVSMEYGHNTVVVCYEVSGGSESTELKIVPLFNHRSPGDTAEKGNLKFRKEQSGNLLKLIPLDNPDLTISFMSSAGEYLDRSTLPVTMATPNYIYEENHYYTFENRNGFLGVDNHYTPYEINITLDPYEQKLFYVKCSIEALDDKDGFTIVREYRQRMDELVRQAGYDDRLANRLVEAADHFIVDRESTGLKTILAGYPWFTDWGRDTMIALQGLTLSTKRFAEAREILESFSKYLRNGLIPNMFPDDGQEPLYNTVDASLWYFHSVYEYLRYTGGEEDYKFIKQVIYPKLKEIISAYSDGTDFSIGMDEDGLIRAGSGLDQVTWMDVRVGEWVVTPRHGKPVEINALWYNALRIMAELSERFGESSPYDELSHIVYESFNKRFWNEEKGCLFDVVDVDLGDGSKSNDEAIRPNQIWAVSLPFTMLPEAKAKAVVAMVYKHLYTPYGLRSLSYEDPNYKDRYIGKLIDRDAAYHMGTVWAFPLGAFITAYCKVNDYTVEAITVAREMCEVFEDHMQDGGLGGIAEIFDGDFSCTGRGCFTQAWSVGEILRAYTEDVLPNMK